MEFPTKILLPFRRAVTTVDFATDFATTGSTDTFAHRDRQTQHLPQPAHQMLQPLSQAMQTTVETGHAYLTRQIAHALHHDESSLMMILKIGSDQHAYPQNFCVRHLR